MSFSVSRRFAYSDEPIHPPAAPVSSYPAPEQSPSYQPAPTSPPCGSVGYRRVRIARNAYGDEQVLPPAAPISYANQKEQSTSYLPASSPCGMPKPPPSYPQSSPSYPQSPPASPYMSPPSSYPKPPSSSYSQPAIQSSGYRHRDVFKQRRIKMARVWYIFVILSVKNKISSTMKMIENYLEISQ